MGEIQVALAPIMTAVNIAFTSRPGIASARLLMVEVMVGMTTPFPDENILMTAQSPDMIPGAMVLFATVLSRRKNNCHDFAACALNEMELPGYKNYTFNCNNLALLAFTKGHFLSFGAFCVSWLPFITIVAIIIGLLFICKCLIENSLLFLVSLKFRTFLELMTSLFTLWTDMFVWTVFSPVADLKAVSTQNCITAVLCKMSMSERRSNPTLPLHNDDTWPHWDNS